MVGMCLGKMNGLDLIYKKKDGVKGKSKRNYNNNNNKWANFGVYKWVVTSESEENREIEIWATSLPRL